MPYIEFSAREKLDPSLSSLIIALRGPAEIRAGDLTYVVDKLMLAYWEDDKHFHRIASLTGAIHKALDEFHDRIVRPYENDKRNINGDVF